jgi:hypothetical protein
MAPAETNKQMADGMLAELAAGVPSFAKSFVQNMFICLFDECTRTAMLSVLSSSRLIGICSPYWRTERLPEQPAWRHALLFGSLRALAFVQRHLVLPRSSPRLAVPVAMPQKLADGSLARMHPDWWVRLAPPPPPPSDIRTNPQTQGPSRSHGTSRRRADSGVCSSAPKLCSGSRVPTLRQARSSERRATG